MIQSRDKVGQTQRGVCGDLQPVHYLNTTEKVEVEKPNKPNIAHTGVTKVYLKGAPMQVFTF